MTFIVVSLGIMFVLNAVVRIIIGPNDINFMDGHKFIMKAREFKQMTGLNEGTTQVITLVTTIITCSIKIKQKQANL